MHHVSTPANNLPVQLTSLVGRAQEIATAQRLLLREDIRLLTLTGPGGAGKTRLGWQVAAELSDRFPDGVFFVNLASLADPALVIPAIARTLTLKETAEQPLLDLLSGFLREKHMLLLLDNFEQVVGAAVQVAQLLASCPKLKVLITSRTVLHIRGEQEFAVAPLRVPDLRRLPDLATLARYEAVALFIQRAQAVRSDFQLTGANASAVAEICVRLDGLPLAIELAAARIQVLSPQALLKRLDQRLALLTGGARDAPARQQTLRNAIEWSYELLEPAERRLFRRLSVFAGGCTLEAVEALYKEMDGSGSGETIALLDRITTLLNNSLLYARGLEDQEPRFFTLDTIREYALQALMQSQELDAARRALASYYLRLVERELQTQGQEQRERWDLLEQEQANIQVALRFALEQAEVEHDSTLALRLGVALTPFWLRRGSWGEGRAILNRALVTRKGVSEPILASALVASGKLAFQQGDYQRAEELAGESLALFQNRGDTRGSASALETLGLVAWNRGHLSKAQTVLQEALAQYRQTYDREGMVSALLALAWLARGRGEYTSARVLCEESLTLASAGGSIGEVADVRLLMAQVLFDTQTDLESVCKQVEDVLALYRQANDKEGIAACFYLSGQIAFFQGAMGEAGTWFEQSIATHKELGHQSGLAWASCGIARVALAQGDVDSARQRYEESVAEINALDDQELLATCLEGLAMVAVAQGEPSWAARLWGAAEALRERIEQPLSPVERTYSEHTILEARHLLGEQTFAKAWAQGRAMTPGQALKNQPQSPTPSPATPVTGKQAMAKAAGLTSREFEVLRLVAEGMTNEQVAAQLVISPRTVDSHLTSIYSKIGVSSRSAATRYAFEHHLV